MAEAIPTIAVLGGTGQEGKALAMRWAKAGHPVVIGSRDAGRAQAAATDINQATGTTRARGAALVDAATAGDIVVLTVPHAAQLPTLEQVKSTLAGKILVDVTVPLVPPRVARVQLPPEGCAAVRAQNELGPDVRVVSALHTVAAARLGSTAAAEEIGDVLVFGDDKASREVVVALLAGMDLTALHGGALANSAATEALTSVLIFLNRRYRADHAGLRIIGIDSTAGAV